MNSPLLLQAIDYMGWSVLFSDAEGETYRASAANGWEPERQPVVPAWQSYLVLRDAIACDGYRELLSIAREELRAQSDVPPLAEIDVIANWRLQSALEKLCASRDPAIADVRFVLGLIVRAADPALQDGAIAVVESLLHRDIPWKPDVVAQELTSALAAVGRRALAQGNLNLAQDALRKAVLRGLVASDPWLNLQPGRELVQLYLGQGRFGAAADIAARVARRVLSGEPGPVVRALWSSIRQWVSTGAHPDSAVSGTVGCMQAMNRLNELGAIREAFCRAVRGYANEQRKFMMESWPEKPAYALELHQALRELVSAMLPRAGDGSVEWAALCECVGTQVSTWADWLDLTSGHAVSIKFLEEHFSWLPSSALVGLRLARAHLWQAGASNSAGVLQRAVDNSRSATERDSLSLACAHYSLIANGRAGGSADGYSRGVGRLDRAHLQAGRSWLAQDWTLGWNLASDVLRRLSEGGADRMRRQFAADRETCGRVAQSLLQQPWQGFFLDKRLSGLPTEFGEMRMRPDVARVHVTARNCGEDYVGEFVIANIAHADGHVEFVKSYQTHSVRYSGQVVGRGLYGWNEVEDHVGGFALWPTD